MLNSARRHFLGYSGASLMLTASGVFSQEQSSSKLKSSESTFSLDGTNKLCYEQPADWIYNTQLSGPADKSVAIRPQSASILEQTGSGIRTWIRIHGSVLRYMRRNGGHIVVVPIAQTYNHRCRSKQNWPIWKFGYGVIITGNEGIAHTEVWTGTGHITCSFDNNYGYSLCRANHVRRSAMPNHQGWFTVGVDLRKTSHSVFTIAAWISKTGQEAKDKLSFIHTAVQSSFFQSDNIQQAVGIAQIPISLKNKFQWIKNEYYKT